MAGRRDPNRFTPRQCATMIYHYGVSRGDALKAATLYRKHISKLPHTPGQVKRLPAYTFFLDLHKSLSDGVITDLPEPDPKFLDTKREDENQSVVLTQLFNLGFKWKPREVATMLYYYGVTGGHALRTANLYRRHVESLPDTGVSKRMPGYGFFLDLYKSLSEGVLSASRDQDCSERTDDRKPRPTLISRVNMNHDRSLDSSSAATSSESDLEVEEPELTSQPEPEPYGCHACNITFSGFVYECVQCEYRMCADCDHAGVHNEHYVLRVPAHSPREEVKEVVSKVRVALNLVELRPPPHAHKKHGRKRRDSDDGPPEVPVIVKMEVDIEEDDPLTFPRSPSPSPCPARVKREPDAAVPSDANMYAMLDTATEPQEDILQVIIKSEPPDEEPSTSQLPTTDPRHAQQLDLQRSQPHPQPQTTDTPGKRGADSAAEGKKPKKGRLKKKVDT